MLPRRGAGVATIAAVQRPYAAASLVPRRQPTVTRPLASASAAAAAAAAAPLAGAAAARPGPAAPARDAVLTDDAANNVSEYIYSKMGINLHHQPSHPIGIIKQAIYDYLTAKHPGIFTTHDGLYPVVSCKANFDEILIPSDHVSRSPNDTYYVSADTVLRCHTSAHQAELLRAKHAGFLATGANERMRE